MKLVDEFKEFALKGNMIDIAIGVIIGAAFNKVVDVIVKEVFLPPLSLLTDGVNWQHQKLVLRDAISEGDQVLVSEIAIGYGKMLETALDFFIISLTVFIVVKFMNRLRKKSQDPADPTETTPKDIELLNKISEQMNRQIELLEQLSDQSKD